MPWFTVPVLRRATVLLVALLLLCATALLFTAMPRNGQRIPGVAADTVSPAANRPTLSGSLAYINRGDVWLVQSSRPAMRLTESGDVSSVRWSPGGGWLLLSRSGQQIAMRPDGSLTLDLSGAWASDDSVVAAAGADGGVDLISPAGGDSRRLVSAEWNVSYQPVAWSPDGELLALERQPIGSRGLPLSASIWLVHRSGDGLRELLPAGATWPHPIGWSPDSRWLAVLHGPAQVCVSCRADGERLEVVSADGSRIYVMGMLLRPEWLSWAPDGSAVVASIGGGREAYRDKQLMLLDLHSGALTVVADQPGAVEIQPVFAPAGAQLAFVRGPAIAGPAFSNLDAAHGFPKAIAGRHIWLAAGDGGSTHALLPADDWADESPRWASPGSVLFVRWRDGGANSAPRAQLMLADAAGSTAVLVDGLSGPDSDVGYYGELGWSSLFAWHP